MEVGRLGRPLARDALDNPTVIRSVELGAETILAKVVAAWLPAFQKQCKDNGLSCTEAMMEEI